MNDREIKRLDSVIYKIREAAEYSGDYLTEEELFNICSTLRRLEIQRKIYKLQ